MLAWLDLSTQGSDALKVAVWYHDCVYVPLAQDNETQSVKVFIADMGDQVSESFRQDVSRLILATDVRRPRSQQSDEQLMADIDLSILSADSAVYTTYATAIRREYAAVPDDEYIAGRSAVLRKILSNPIYSTDLFMPREPLARRNIEDELLRLDEE
jgi:predicted metal-dependent HD superfamily phosphohydrolase